MELSSYSEQQLKQLKKLAHIFEKKNQHINLSAIRDHKGIWEKHIVDSLASKNIITKQNPSTILDMGTGGGFPTLPLAICFPEIRFFAVDSVQKKLKCVAEFAKELELSNVFILNGRAEELAHQKKHREQYDMIVTRAFANFSPMLEMTLPFLKEKGMLLSFRGPEYDVQHDEEVLDYFGGFCPKIHRYELSGGEKREIWEIIKVEPSSKEYPRKTGIPKKEPIQMNI